MNHVQIENQDRDSLSCRLGQADIFAQSNLNNCAKYVQSIQRRDKAVANGDKSSIRWYSHILMKRSRAVKTLAVNRVCRVNQGKHTAGVDGIGIPKDRLEAQVMMMGLIESIDITKKPDPIRRVYIPKPNGDSSVGNPNHS